MCDVLGVETEDEKTIIVLRVAQERHLKFIREGSHPKDAEWALELEFNRPCKLRVLSPDQPYAGGANQGSASYSLGTVATPPSAYREPGEPEVPLVQRANQPRPPGPQPSPTQRNSTLAEKPEAYQTSANMPLARTQGVRENKKVPLSKEELERKVRQDPVVQQVIQTFGATIGNIHPK